RTVAYEVKRLYLLSPNFTQMKITLCLILLLSSAHALAQNGLPPNAGARGAAPGNTSAAFQGMQSAFTNAAGLATLPSWGFAGMDLLNTRVPDFGNRLNATGSLGIQANFAEPLWLGFHLFNPFRIQRQNGDYYPTLMKAGFSYQFSQKLLLAGEAEKDIDFPL